MIWLLSIVLTLATATLSEAKTKKSSKKAAPAAVRTKLSKVATCKPPAPPPPAEDGAAAPEAKPKNVLVIKQWHLSPKTITKSFKERYPQEKNQTAIYNDLANRIKANKLQLIVAEGCEGEINDEFKAAFNGWDYASLAKVSQTKGYEKILTLVPLKIEARYNDKVLTMCGDSEKLIQEGNLRVSNLRGWFGFVTRLSETYEDDKGRLYSDAAADLLKVPKNTPVPELLKQIQVRIKEDLAAFRKSLSDRNDGFVKVLQEKPFETAAVVIGGLHAEDLKEKLEAANLACEVYEPPGYQKEAEQLVLDFEKALAGR